MLQTKSVKNFGNSPKPAHWPVLLLSLTIGAVFILGAGLLVGVDLPEKFIAGTLITAAAFAALALLGVRLETFRQRQIIHSYRHRLRGIQRNAHNYMLSRLADLRRPLQGILGVRDVYDVEAKSPEMRDFLDVVDHCVKFVVKQFDRVQFFSEFATDKIAPSTEPFDLYEMIKRAVGSAEQSVFGTEVKIDLSIDKRVPRYVAGDMRLTERVLSELLANAVKHINQGPVHLDVRLSGNSSDEVSFIVTDHGPGMGRQELANSLNSVQPDSFSLSWDGARQGLGIPIIRNIVARLKGYYSIDTQLGHGTRFVVTLPLPPSDIELRDVLVEREHEHAASSRILVVDDDLITRKLLSTLLSKIGYDVTIASDGHEAVRLYNQKRPGVIFMDLEMPLMDGFQATSEILDIAGEQKPKIIALMANANNAEREKCEAAGMSDTLTKPVGLPEVRAVLDRLGVKPLRNIQAPQRPPVHAQHAKLIDLPRMYGLHGEDGAVVRDVLVQCREIFPYLQDQLDGAVIEGQAPKLGYLLHRLKNDFATVHCDVGAEVCTAMEALSAQPNTIEFLDLYEKLNDILDRITAELDYLINVHDFSALIE